MNQGFKFKLKVDEMKENAPVNNDENYQSGSNVRNVCFVQIDGKMLFLNYGYLVSCEYLPDDSIVVLNFTSHIITLKGSKLESLYQEFFNHIPKVVNCTEDRYTELIEDNSSLIIEMKVERNST
ncbi:MAG TPA: hypothetical protein PKU77_00790 [Ferruginibacter sp.]|nr:hypothetical protein [Ferruginibacter sp.]